MRLQLDRRQLLWTLAIGYLIYSTAITPLDRELVVFVDSSRYAQGADVLSPDNPGILTSLLYTQVTSSLTTIWVQIAVASVSWLLLAVGVARVVSGDLGLVLAGIILLYSLTRPIVGWQWAQLTEGLSLSLFALWLGFLINLLASRRRIPWFSGALVVGLLAVLARPQLVVVILPVELVSVVLLLRRGRPRNPVMGLWLGLMAGQVAFAAVRLYQASRVDGLQQYYGIRNLLSKWSYRDYAREMFANCPPVRAFVDGTSTALPGIAEVQSQCPETNEWLLSSDSSGTALLLRSPIDSLREFIEDMGSDQSSYVFPADDLSLYAHGPAGIPDAWADLVLPISFPLYLLLPVLLLVGLAMLIKADRLTASPARLAMGVTTVLASFAYLVVTWAADGAEIHRHMYPVLAMLPLMALMAAPLLLERKSVTTTHSRRVGSVEHGGDTEG